MVGKNSSGKSSITHLLSMMDSLIGVHRPIQYRCFSSDFINMYSFHNYLTTGLKLGVVNGGDQELYVSFIRNVGKLYLLSVEVIDKGRTFKKEFTSNDRKEASNDISFIEPVLNEWGFELASWSYKSNYIAPVRSIPDSIVGFNSSNVGEVRSRGENVYDILLDSFRGDKVLFNQVSNWLYTYMDRQRLTVDPLVGDYYSIGVDNSRGADVPIEDVGEGISQVMPIIIQSYLEKKSDLTIIEQPALHLHPAAHAAVTDRLIESIIRQKKTYVIESHSANILLALRRAVVNPEVNITSKDVIVYFLDIDSDKQVAPIEINDFGELSSWPTGVFGEGSDLVKDILRIRK